MYKATCPKCGRRYYGWALGSPQHQTCDECLTSLEITDLNAVTQSSGHDLPSVQNNQDTMQKSGNDDQ